MARKIIKQTSSFGVLRANPRISGNVKITVDSNDDIWLNSIDSNSEMSNQAYKGFRISPESSYDRDLYTFFGNGSTSPQSVFGLVGESDPVQNQINDLSNTYNLAYATGVTPLISDKYPENFSYLSPLWLGEDIPDHFVIFKVNDPIDYPYQIPVTSLVIGKTYKVVQDPTIDVNSPTYLPFQITSGSDVYADGNIFVASLTTFNINQGGGSVLLLDPLYHLNDINDSSSHFYDKILPKATLVSTFDLRENSKIGKYLRNIKNAPGYTDNLIDVRFEENQLTTYNGVNYSAGIFDKKGDFLLDYFQTPQTQIGFEDFITDGFRRNSLISYKLLNLEFLFNDTDSDNYTINRYFGLYVNAPEIASFRLDGNALYNNQGQSGNTPVPLRKDKGYYNDEASYYQYNDKGVRIFVDPNFISGVIPNSDTINIIEDTKLFWIKDKNGKFHSLKRDEEYSLSSPVSSYSTYGLPGTENSLVLQDTSVDLSIFSGQDTATKKQYSGNFIGEKGRAYVVIRIGGQLNNTTEDAFVFYHPLGTYGSPGGKYDIIKASDLSSVIDEWGPGSYYAQDNAYYYHPFGTNEDIAKALNGIFNSFNYNSFESFQSGDELVIRVIATGEKENSKYYLDFFQNFTTSQRIPTTRKGLVFINEKDASYINQRQSFIGGSDHINSRIKVKIEDANKIEIGETFLETTRKTLTDTFTGLPDYTNKGSSVVIGKYRFVDQYSTDQGGAIIGLKDFESHATIEVQNFLDRISLGSSNKISAFNPFDISLGIFSFYGLRELDTDFWYSQYGYTPTEEYYKYLDIQPDGKTKIVPGRSYYVSDGTTISYNSSTIPGPNFFEGIPGVEEYSLLSVSATSTAESNVYPTLSTRGNIQTGITLANFDYSFYPDLDAFPGFYGIQALKFINNEVGIITKKDQVTFGKLDSEYDYTQDNYNTDFATKSRVSPYITKWAYRGGTDVRGNDYRLNSNIAFSPLNFSPSFFRRIQDPQYFTHEWYQLQRPPYSLPESNIHNDKSYLSGELSETLLKDANPALRDYFLDYFSIEGEDLISYYYNSTTIDNINLSERYTVFDFNSANGSSETLFRGARIKIKRTFSDYGQGETVRYLNDDLFYDGYKFSCVITPIENIPEKIQPPIKIKVIENRTFKSITFVLEVLIDDARIYDFEDISPEKQYLDLDYFLLYSLKDKLSKSSTYAPTFSPWFPSGILEIPKIGDIKLSSALNITSVPTASGLFSTVNAGTVGAEGEIYIIPNNGYDTDLREEISFTYLSSTVPGPTGSTGPGSFYGFVGTNAVTGSFGYTLPFPTGVGQDFVNFTNTSANYIFNFIDISLPGPLNIPTIANLNTVKQIPIYQRDGGTNYWKNLLEKISFANISLWINTGYPYIEYKSYIWDSVNSTTQELNNQFVIEFIKPSVFEQDTTLITEEITDKPSELALFNVGYTVQNSPIKSELYRYSGGYIPKFREIIKFENVKYDIPYWTVPQSYTYKVKVVDKLSTSKYSDLGSFTCYEINGIIQNVISLIKGVTYYFDLSDSSNSGYQLYFSKSDIGNSFSTDSLLQGYIISGTPGTPSSYVEYTVPYDIDDIVYYVAQGGNYMGQKLKLIDSIEYSYCSFGPNKDNFGTIKNINYYKYSTEWIYRIGKNSPYNPVYNLIGETPVDKRDLSLFESSWDPGFYRQYTSPSTYTDLPGTRSMQEVKSFFGSKVMQTPNSVNSQKQIVYPTSLSNVLDLDYTNYPNYEILWENTPTELRGIVLMDRILARYFLEDGAKQTFLNFIVPEFGFGSLSDINDDFNEYMRLNITPIYQSKNNGTYLKKVPVQNSSTLTSVIGDLADYQKITNGYLPSQEIRYTKVNELRYEFKIPKDPSFNYSIAFSLQIGKI